MTKYTSDNIETLRFPDSVRSNPSMYIGGTDEHGMFVILRECADNAVDEFLAGRNTEVMISVDSDGSYWVLDSGSGIPQGMKKSTLHVNGKDVVSKMPTMQAVFGELHTSGKFKSDAYKTSIGCFAGETPVELVDGRTLSMRQIYKEHKRGIQNFVWTVNRKTGDLRAQPIERALMTGQTRHLVEVTLNTGAKFVCTPDHPLYQTSLKKLEAEDSHGASLLSLDFETDRDGYRVLPVVGNWPIRLHRVVASYSGQDVDGKHVHHLDENKLNNEPHNLKALSVLDHYLEHPEKLETWMTYLARSSHEKSALLNKRNSKNWYIKIQQQGKAVKIACRIFSLGLPINAKTFNANHFHGAAQWDKAVRRFDSADELRAIARDLVLKARELAPKFAYAARFLKSLEYTPGLSDSAMCFDQSERMRARRLVGKAVAALVSMPASGATSDELNQCFSQKSRVSTRALCQYVDLDEFVSAVRNDVDPCDFLYADLSADACMQRRNKFDKDDASTRVLGWGMSAVNRQSRQFLRNLNAMLADGEQVSQANYHARFKNACGNSSWYLGVRACSRLGVKGRDAILEAAEQANHKVIKVRHLYFDDDVPVYDLSVGIDHNYRLACGVFVGNTHGVGVKGTNATSEYLKVWTCYDGAWYSVGFERGKLTSPVATAKAPKSPFTAKQLKRGTLIHFKPDAKIFSVKSFPASMLVSWAEVQAYLNPGLRVTVQIKGKTKSWFSKEGPKAWVTQKLAALKADAEPDMFQFSNELVTLAVAFSNADGFELKGFTNGLQNSQGGKHVNSVANALYTAITPFMGRAKFSNNDFADGMLGIVNAKLHKPSFSSQDKAKLTDDRMGKDFELAMVKVAEKFFKANKAMAKRLVERATKINELKGKFKASKAVATALNKLKRGGLPSDYAPAHRSVPVKDRELIIVEGKSAAGGVREIRGPHQALLPLTGKVMNAWKASGDKVLLSKAIINILAAIGFDPKAEDPLRRLQVGKIICMSDADADGRHINCLLNALFSRYMPGMYDLGIIYVADMPEFYSIGKDQLFVGDTLSEVQGKLKAAKVKGDVLHAKGWGEVDPEILRILIASSARRLIKLEPLSAEDLQIFRGLMGKDVDRDEKPEKAEKKAKTKKVKAEADESKVKGKKAKAVKTKTKPKKERQ